MITTSRPAGLCLAVLTIASFALCGEPADRLALPPAARIVEAIRLETLFYLYPAPPSAADPQLEITGPSWSRLAEAPASFFIAGLGAPLSARYRELLVLDDGRALLVTWILSGSTWSYRSIAHWSGLRYDAETAEARSWEGSPASTLYLYPSRGVGLLAMDRESQMLEVVGVKTGEPPIGADDPLFLATMDLMLAGTD